jgi:hypothetical protein
MFLQCYAQVIPFCIWSWEWQEHMHALSGEVGRSDSLWTRVTVLRPHSDLLCFVLSYFG